MPLSPGRVAQSGALSNKLSKRALPTTGELFERLWVKNDPRGHGGDGLGPVFNGQSCVACHNLGGSGGAGTVGSNIEIATATGSFNGGRVTRTHSARILAREGLNPGSVAVRKRAPVVYKQPVKFLSGIHPGFRDSNSVVLHRFGTDPTYHAWASQFPGSTGRS